MTPRDFFLVIFDRLGLLEAGGPEHGPAPVPDMAIDELEDAYIAWRETCFALRAAYERWLASEPSDRDFAFAGYGAALQQEEHAAHVYRSRIELITT